MDNQNRIYIGDICYISVHTGAQLVRIADGMCIELSATEYKILLAFIEQKNKALTLEGLARILWGSNSEKDPNSIKSQITRIRTKLDQIQPGLGKKCLKSSKRGFSSYILEDVWESSPDVSTGGKGIVSPKKTTGTENEIVDENRTASSREAEKYSLYTNCPLPDLVATQIDGYADEILRVCNQLSLYNNNAALVGMGGVGKSELAKAIAERSSGIFTTRLWVNYSNSLLETITNDNTFSIWGCNRGNYPKDTDRQYFDRKIRILKALSSRHVLIVVDGFNTAEDPDLEDFLSGEYAVLITTQYQPTAGNLPTFEITHFKDEAKQFALFEAKYRRHIEYTEVEDIWAMIRSWKGHTLGICVLATTMRDKRLSPKEMRALLCDRQNCVTENHLVSRIRSDLHKVFQLNSLSTDEQYVMQNLALIPESGISIKEFIKWLETDDYTLIDDLIERSLIIHDSYADTIHLHSMIADLMLPMLSDSVCTNLVNNLVATCKNAFDCSYMRKLELLGYAQSIYDKISNEFSVHLTIGMQLGNILELLGKYNESADVFKALREKTNSGSLQVVLDSKIAHGLLLAGNLNEGYIVALEGHNFFQCLQEEQIDKQAQRADNWLLQRLCEYCRWIGNYDAAEAYGNDSIRLFQNDSREAAWDIGWSKYHLAHVLLLRGEMVRCIQHLTDAILLFNEIGSEYSSAFAMELLGQAYMLEGDYSKAIDLTVSAGSILHRFLDSNHADCGRNWMCKGNILRRAGQAEDALKCYSEAISVFRTSHETKASLVEALLYNNEIILDLWGEAFQLDNAI